MMKLRICFTGTISIFFYSPFPFAITSTFIASIILWALKELLSLYAQMICGVEYCHTNMVVDRDLKPENLL